MIVTTRRQWMAVGVITGLLVTAGILKLMRLWAGQYNPDDALSPSMREETALAAIEIGLGLLWLRRSYWRRLLPWTCAAFALFAIHNLMRWQAGFNDCDCFGDYHVSVGSSLGIDGLALVILFALSRTLKPVALQSRKFQAAMVFVVLAIGVIGTVWAMDRHAARLSGGELVLSEPGFNFGYVGTIANQSYDHIFKLTNTSRHAITILSAGTTCGCTVANFAAGPIMPGETRNIDVKINYAGHRGPQMSMVNLTTDDPSQRSVEIQISGYADIMGGVSPSAIDFGNVHLGSYEQVVTVSASSPRTNLLITKVIISDTAVTVTPLTIGQSEDTYRVKLNLTGLAARGFSPFSAANV
jgi:hypothetical protein